MFVLSSLIQEIEIPAGFFPGGYYYAVLAECCLLQVQKLHRRLRRVRPRLIFGLRDWRGYHPDPTLDMLLEQEYNCRVWYEFLEASSRVGDVVLFSGVIHRAVGNGGAVRCPCCPHDYSKDFVERDGLLQLFFGHQWDYVICDVVDFV